MGLVGHRRQQYQRFQVGLALLALALVTGNPNDTTAQDVDVLRAAGLSDAEIFEATTFIAFRLAFSTVNDALGIPPDWQLAEAAPAQVREAVTFGRPISSRT